MIDSWKALVNAVHEMRQLQQNPYTTKSTEKKALLSRLESDVDEAVARKLTKWDAQGEFFKKGEEYGAVKTEREKN